MGRKRKAAKVQPIEEVVETKRRKNIDVDHDLTGSFFEDATNSIVEHSLRAAVDLKYYINIIASLNTKYQRLRKNYAQLLPKLDIAADKLRTSLELTATSDDCLEQLKNFLVEAWQAVDASHLREQNTQEKLVLLEDKADIYFEAKIEEDDNQEFGQLATYKNMILRERDRLNAEVKDLSARLQTHRNYTETLEYINEKQAETLKKEKFRSRKLETENERLDNKNNNLMNILEDLRASNNTAMQKLEQGNRELAEIQAKLAKLNGEHDHMKLNMEKLLSEKMLLNRQINSYIDDIKSLKKDRTYLDEIIRKMRLEDKANTRMIAILQEQNKKSQQDYTQVSKKLYKIDRANDELRQENISIRNSAAALKKELNLSFAKYNDLNVQLEFSNRERILQREAAQKAQKVIADLKHTQMLNAVTIDSLKLNIKKLNAKAEETLGIISHGEKERNELAQEILNLNDRINNYQLQVTAQTEKIDELTEKREQLYLALSNMKKQLDSAHSTNFILKRKLDSCGQESDDMKNTVNKKNFQISQMSNEIAANNMSINSLKSKIDRVYNEKKNMQNALQTTEAILGDVRKDLKDMKFKNENLHKIISDDELKILKITQELEDTRKERNLEGLQLVRRNDEMLLLKEKMSIIQHAVDNGTSSYNQRLEDIRILKSEILQLQTERECLKRALMSTANQREELIRVQRKLNEEQIKVRALTEDLKIPVGIHRWRVMKGEDPSQFELIQRVQLLQKRNVQLDNKYKKVLKEMDDMEKLNKSLKNNVEHLLKKYDVEEKLVHCQRINRKQEKKLKSITAELRILEIETGEKTQECKTFKHDLINHPLAIKEAFQEQNLFEFSTEKLLC